MLIVFVQLILCCILIQPVFARETEKEDIQSILTYAEILYDEGKYEQAVKECELILSLDLGHLKSREMISMCRNKIDLVAGLINQAMDEYKKSALVEAVEKLEMAYEMDDKNHKLKALMVKVLTELGMGYNFIAMYREALNCLERAQELSPDDVAIHELIQISRSMILEPAEEEIAEVNENREVEKLEEMLAVFEKHRERQDGLILDYSESQAKIQQLLESSESEKKKLYNMLKEKEMLLSDFIAEQKGKRQEFAGFIKRNSLIIGSLAVLTVVLVVFLINRQVRIKQINLEIEKKQKELQRVQEAPLKDRKVLSDYERKIKKLEIIESELAGENPYENQVALNMLEQFLTDKDFRIRLRVIKVMHSINAGAAVDILNRIIKQEKNEYKVAACKLLGEFESPASVKLLLELDDRADDDMRKSVVSSLANTLNRKGINNELKDEVRNKLDAYAQQGGWIV